jgi:hypothetical protein
VTCLFRHAGGNNGKEFHCGAITAPVTALPHRLNIRAVLLADACTSSLACGARAAASYLCAT